MNNSKNSQTNSAAAHVICLTWLVVIIFANKQQIFDHTKNVCVLFYEINDNATMSTFISNTYEHFVEPSVRKSQMNVK